MSKKIVMLADMKTRLQARMNYDDPDSAFDSLLFGFGKFMKFSISWKYNILQNGYMSMALAHQFANYVGYPIDQN